MGDHHLGAGVGPVRGEDVVLGAVCEAVEEEVDAEEEEAPRRGLLDGARAGGFFGRRGVVEGEDGDAGGDEEDDEVFVEGVAFAEDGQVEEHYREELAGFGEDEGDIVDVRQTGVAERGGEGGGDGDEDEGKEDGF